MTLARPRSWVLALALPSLAALAFAPALVRAQDGARPAAASPKHVLIAREGDSFLEEIDGQRVLHLAGDPYSMGLAHGKLLKAEARACVDAYVHLFAMGVAGHGKDSLRETFAKAKPFVPTEYLEEMRGLADGSGIPLEDVQIAHIVPELHHCSGAAVMGPMTRDGKLYHYRSLDYPLELGGKTKVQDNACLIVRKPAKGIATVVVGWAGTLGCVTGMSAEGISLGEMGSTSSAETLEGTPMWFRVRWILENCRTLAEGQKGFEEWKRTCGYNFIITDGKIPDARAVEVDRDRVAFFAPGDEKENQAPHSAIPNAVRRVNHFVDPELAGRQRKIYDPSQSERNSWEGYRRITEYLLARKGKLDGEGMVALCRNYPKQHSCLHQAVFCSSDLRFWVANAKNPDTCELAGAQNQTFYPYDLKALLAQDPAALEVVRLERAPEQLARKTDGDSGEGGARGDTPAASPEAKALEAARLLKLLKGEPSGTAKDPELGAKGKDDGEDVAKALEFLKLPPSEFPYRLEESKSKADGYKKYRVRYPSAAHTIDESDVVVGNYYEPTGRKPGERLPAVVVVHHLGGGFEAEEFMASYFADNNLAAMTISLPGYGERRGPKATWAGFIGHDDPKDDLAGMRQAILDVVRAADFLRSRPEVDPEHVGTVGVSLGCIVAADASGFDPRFARSVLVIGGGDLFSVVANESRETRGQLARMHKAGFTDEQIKEGFKVIDPDTFAPRLRSPDVLMLNALRDEVFPKECTLRLWRHAGYPKIRWFDTTHAGIFRHLPDAIGDALDHLKGSTPRREAD